MLTVTYKQSHIFGDQYFDSRQIWKIAEQTDTWILYRHTATVQDKCSLKTKSTASNIRIFETVDFVFKEHLSCTAAVCRYIFERLWASVASRNSKTNDFCRAKHRCTSCAARADEEKSRALKRALRGTNYYWGIPIGSQKTRNAQNIQADRLYTPAPNWSTISYNKQKASPNLHS